MSPPDAMSPIRDLLRMEESSEGNNASLFITLFLGFFNFVGYLIIMVYLFITEVRPHPQAKHFGHPRNAPPALDKLKAHLTAFHVLASKIGASPHRGDGRPNGAHDGVAPPGRVLGWECIQRMGRHGRDDGSLRLDSRHQLWALRTPLHQHFEHSGANGEVSACGRCFQSERSLSVIKTPIFAFVCLGRS